MKKHLVLLFYGILSILLFVPLMIFSKNSFIHTILSLFSFQVKIIPLVITILSFSLVFIYDLFFDDDEDQFMQNYITIQNLIGPNHKKIKIIAVSFLSGLTEEFLFRGYLLFFLVDVVSFFPIPAVIVVSLIFGVFHLNQGKVVFVMSAVISSALCYFVLQTGSLVIPILFHMLFNFSQLSFVIPFQKNKFMNGD